MKGLTLCMYDFEYVCMTDTTWSDQEQAGEIFSTVLLKVSYQAYDFAGLFTNHPFASLFSWKKRSSPQGKKEVACIVFQTSGFLFVGMWRVCKSSKIKHPGGSGGFVLKTEGRVRSRPVFQDFYNFVQVTSLTYMYRYIHVLYAIYTCACVTGLDRKLRIERACYFGLGCIQISRLTNGALSNWEGH